MLNRLVNRGMSLLNRLFKRYSWTGRHVFFESRQFAWARDLESHWKVIHQELMEVLAEGERIPTVQAVIGPNVAHLNKDNGWRTFFFHGYGVQAKDNCRRCPETARLINRIPGMNSALFSILEPGSHIPNHMGEYAGILRCQLGLIVPEPQERCRIQVSDTVTHWEQGKCLIFDDTYPHEVWNDTSGKRVVLFVNFLRPLPLPLAILNRLVIGVLDLQAHHPRRHLKNSSRNARPANASC